MTECLNLLQNIWKTLDRQTVPFFVIHFLGSGTYSVSVLCTLIEKDSSWKKSSRSTGVVYEKIYPDYAINRSSSCFISIYDDEVGAGGQAVSIYGNEPFSVLEKWKNIFDFTYSIVADNRDEETLFAVNGPGDSVGVKVKILRLYGQYSESGKKLDEKITGIYKIDLLIT